MNFSRSSIGLHSFQGILLSPQKAQLCNLCLRNEVSPISQEGHKSLREFFEGRPCRKIAPGRLRKGATVLHPRATPERLSAFSDGVFAVLITVLVLELRPPELPTFEALLLLWPTWLSYAVSYLFIAIVWTNHHHLMRHATEATPRLLWSNLSICFPCRCFRSPLPGWR
ncbi:MAG TPA: TMEM175 family protein [Xanthobacteraceae bacterium]